ncbi:concanavalin A-like lectin/glucanase domain-containing protein [Cyathus striatus]|nr:concanavalin A-like lectin/glucanase domain-containing protein [Cyathus striatus]
MVNYLNRSEAQQKNLFYVQDDGIVIMKADNTTTLQAGQFRDSIRIQSQAEYTTGLFILDLNHAPWGCAIWPAFWTTGASWPANGEVDIIEGVHDNEHNQVAWHTLPGCTLNPQTSFSGNISSNHTDCDATIDDNAGCSITEWSRASYGPFFDSQGGGVFAMKWDNDSIGVWSFYRAAVPQDIVSGSPDPDNWGVPSAMLDSSQCNISQYFANHNIIFDITFCGDWAGNSYATSGCPGTCEERLMDPSNFDNASWSINSLKVYKRQVLNGQIESSAITNAHMSLLFWILIYAAVGEAILRLL